LKIVTIRIIVFLEFYSIFILLLTSQGWQQGWTFLVK